MEEMSILELQEKMTSGELTALRIGKAILSGSNR